MTDRALRPQSPAKRFRILFLGLAAVLFFGFVSAHAASMQRVLYGEVLEAEKATVTDHRPRHGGATGSTVGAVAGYALADPRDRWLGAIIGGVVGGAAGKSAAKRASRKKGWKLIVRLENGEEIGLDVPNRKEQYLPGDQLRLMSSPQGTKVRKMQR